MFTIGLIDEEDLQLRTIRATIKENTPTGKESPNFKVYELLGTAATLTKSIVDQIINDIIMGAIASLIIDYKIMIDTAMVEGTDIYKIIIETVPQFPLIILTDVPDACYKKAFIDADKIYRKSEFFKVKTDYSREKVINIFRNAERYLEQRESLTLIIDTLKEKLLSEGVTPEIFEELLSTESELSSFSPQGLSELEKAFKAEQLQEVVKILEQANKLIED